MKEKGKEKRKRERQKGEEKRKEKRKRKGKQVSESLRKKKVTASNYFSDHFLPDSFLCT